MATSSARHGAKRLDRVGIRREEPAHLLPPGLLDPLDHRTEEVAHMRLSSPTADCMITVRVLRPDQLPEPFRSASGLERIDYADVATARTPGATRWTPEQWARAAVERGSLVRLGGPFVWRAIVGLRLAPRHAPGHVAGWRIGARGEDWLRLEAASWHVTAHAIVHVADDRVAVALLVRHDRPAAALLRPPVTLLHRRGIPTLLRQAQRLLRQREPTERMTSPKAVHQGHRWVTDEVAPDFALLDVWALPAHGRRAEFAAFLQMMATWNPTATTSVTSRVLFAARRYLGAALGWDDPSKQWPIPGCTETTLLDRLPANLRRTAADAPAGSDAMRRLGAHLVPLYRTDQEAAAEISNATVHGILQFTWVEQRQGRYQAHLAVYVKPRGMLGRAYLLLIQPFRHLVVYPALLRQVERTWTARSPGDGARSS